MWSGTLGTLIDEADEQQHERPPLRANGRPSIWLRELIGVLAQLLQGQDVERVLRRYRRREIACIRLVLGGVIEPRLTTPVETAGRSAGSLRRSLLKYSIKIAISMQHAADERVQEELDRGVFLARAAPDADQEVHRQEHDFPEHVEQEEIERAEHAQHAGFQQQEQDAVGLLRIS